MTFQDVTRQVFSLYRDRDYAAALAVAIDARSSFPAEDNTLTFWEACLLARLGERDRSVQTLLAGIERGEWWPTGKLVDHDLDPVRDHPGWAAVLAHCEAMTERLRANRPAPMVRGGSGDGTVVTIQGAHAVQEDFFATWDQALPGRWTLITPVASEPTGDGPWEWPHSVEASAEVVVADLLDFDLAPPLILAGFSAGSAIAGHLILSGELEVEGLISIAPWTRRDFDELVEASLVMPTLVICGADDSLISVDKLRSRVKGEDGQVELQVVDGLGHEHPMDLAQRVARFLEGL